MGILLPTKSQDMCFWKSSSKLATVFFGAVEDSSLSPIHKTFTFDVALAEGVEFLLSTIVVEVIEVFLTSVFIWTPFFHYSCLLLFILHVNKLKFAAQLTHFSWLRIVWLAKALKLARFISHCTKWNRNDFTNESSKVFKRIFDKNEILWAINFLIILWNFIDMFLLQVINLSE